MENNLATGAPKSISAAIAERFISEVLRGGPEWQFFKRQVLTASNEIKLREVKRLEG